MKNAILIIPLFLVLLLSCETDFDVNAQWEEVTVVFGLLDQSEDTQYVRINKAFLGDLNAYEMAEVADSIHYDPSILEVRIDKVNASGEVKGTVNLVPEIREKDEGMFATEGNIVYAFASNNFLTDNKNYNLVINNVESGNTVTATTKLIHDFTFVGSTSSISFFINTPDGGYFPPNVIKWTPAKNAAIYQVTMSVHYYEYPPGTPAEEGVLKTISKVFPIVHLGDMVGDEFVQMITGEEFFSFLDNSIEEDPTVHRKLHYDLDILISVASSDLQTYINLNQPTIGIVQERPIFTNITNGIGLFSSRYNKSQQRTLGEDTREYVTSTSLEHLNFQYP